MHGACLIPASRALILSTGLFAHLLKSVSSGHYQ